MIRRSWFALVWATTFSGVSVGRARRNVTDAGYNWVAELLTHRHKHTAHAF